MFSILEPPPWEHGDRRKTGGKIYPGAGSLGEGEGEAGPADRVHAPPAERERAQVQGGEGGTAP